MAFYLIIYLCVSNSNQIAVKKWIKEFFQEVIEAFVPAFVVSRMLCLSSLSPRAELLGKCLPFFVSDVFPLSAYYIAHAKWTCSDGY